MAEPKYTKSAILRDKKYAKYVDLVTALLDDDKTYSLRAVDKKINEYIKGGAK